jgi:hypothetical protein
MSDLDDQRSDEEYLRDFLAPMSPLGLLNWITATLTERAPHTLEGRLQPKSPLSLLKWIVDKLRSERRTPLEGRIRSLSLAMTSGQPSPEQLTAMNAQADARRRMLDASPAFRAALARTEAAGVSHKWGGSADYGYTSRDLTFIIPLGAISRLQDMAADDADIDNPEERRQAAERYRRWLLQNYHPDWKAYQERWPIERNPYFTERNDFGRDPNP